MQLHYRFEQVDIAQAFADEIWDAIDSQYHIESEDEWQAQHDGDSYDEYRRNVQNEQHDQPTVELNDVNVKINITTTSHNMIILASLLVTFPGLFPSGHEQDEIGFYVV